MRLDQIDLEAEHLCYR